MTGNEVRKKYIDYFRKNNHKVIRSSSLVPNDDPTLLFTNAGMVQFKRTFLGEEKRYYNRATSSQKCVRAGGKHNDLENVGYTSRHHTFFEMLGNFSFGDYFKQKTIELAWDLIVNVYKLPSEKIWASVHLDDDESYELWQHNIGIPESRIIRLGNKENFWSMGDTGPCGPCSELHIDRGESFGCGNSECNVSCNCDRFVEIWNLVFMQFNRDKAGNMTPLPEPSIDTGLGLERLTAIIQNVETTFETDLILPIIHRSEVLAEIKFGQNKKHDIAMKVIADHSRAAAFLIGDGVLPSNEGRGYVLRRIIRRAIRYGRSLNLNNPFLYDTVQVVFNIMEKAYPELKKSAEHISKVIKNEEIRFSETIDNGLKLLNESLEELKYKGKKIVPGDLIFKLHDTYGFPVDIIRDVIRDKNIILDLDGFNTNMDKQRLQSHSKKTFDNVSAVYKKLALNNFKSKFVGYNSLTTEAKIILIAKEGIQITTATKGSSIEIVTDYTSLYGESGGQIGDQGTIEATGVKISIEDTIKDTSGIIIHKGKVTLGTIKVGQKVLITTNADRRYDVSRNHTTTHILHAVLRQELGTHVKQSGSLVSENRLRFDFAHFSRISKITLENIEKQVNEQIINNILIKTVEMPVEKAMESGAMALFGEKYEEQVRIISIGTLSKELCGGTHVKRTGNIGFFKIISEYGIASGIRRIEAKTGHSALKHIQKLSRLVNDTNSLLKTSSDDIINKISDIKKDNKLLEKKVEKIAMKNAILTIKLSNNSSTNSGNLLQYNVINGIKVKTEKVAINTASGLRKMIDHLINEIKSGIVALGCEQKGKALLIVGVTKDLTNKFNASEMVNEIAKLVEGKGGGRADMAQAGGGKPQNIDQALEKIKVLVDDTK